MLYSKQSRCHSDTHGNVVLCVLYIHIPIFNILTFEVSNVLRVDNDIPCGRVS
jgi:hypothetical protein